MAPIASAGNAARPSSEGAQLVCSTPRAAGLVATPCFHTEAQALVLGASSLTAAAGSIARSWRYPPPLSTETHSDSKALAMEDELELRAGPHSHAQTLAGCVDAGSITLTSAPPPPAGMLTFTQSLHRPAWSSLAAQLAATIPARVRHTAAPRGASDSHGIGARPRRLPPLDCRLSHCLDRRPVGCHRFRTLPRDGSAAHNMGTVG